MKVVVLNLTGGGLSGGYRKYLMEVVPRLRENSLIRSLHNILPPEARSHFQSPDRDTLFWPNRVAARRRWWLRGVVRELQPDVIFIPTARWMPFEGTPVVSMVRNMEPLSVPWEGNPPPEKLKNALRRAIAWYAIRRADHVIAVSTFVERFLTDRWRVPHSRVSMIHHGTSPVLLASALQRPVVLSSTERRPFVFTAGSLRPARGLEDILAAWRLMPDVARTHVLLIGGETDPGMQRYVDGLKAQAAAMTAPAQVVWAGQLSPAEMGWCFRNCRAFVMTSRAEACPNTAIEAMSYGAPCVTTDNDPMPEFFSSAARYYQARSALSLAGVLGDLLCRSSDEVVTMQAAGMKRSEDFSWNRTAELTAETLRQVSLRA
jgi:glycosyltransferase involved in cell wall biosynthesis